MSIVIQVENLSKKYIIGHQKQESYSTLRDVISNKVTDLFKKVFNPMSFHLPASSSSTEDFWALKDVSFEIKQGDRVGIIGRNGAGKSTLLKILSRITEPTSGKISIRGRVSSLLEVGTGFHPELTGRENIFLNGAVLGMSKNDIKRKFDGIVAFAEVEKFLDTPVKHFSSGMYVRLAFAVAAHLEPEILIVDEVLAVGDAQFQKKCLGKMEEVGKEGRTVLFVSHNMAAVKTLCDRACLITDGSLSFDGDPAETVSRYLQISSGSECNGDKIYKHVKGDGRARIEKIYLSNNMRGLNRVSVFDIMGINMDYVLNEAVSELEFFVLIHSEDGDVITSLFQRDSGKNTKPLSKQGKVTVKFKNYLLPGQYLISAGIFDKSRQFLDWVELAESFYIEQTFDDGRIFDRRLGKISLIGEWSDSA